MQNSKIKRIFFVNKRYFLPSEKSFIISLDPSSSFFLSENKIEYHILQEYYNEEELREREDVYFFEQLEWFSDFDNFIKDNICLCREYNINLATSNYLRIKYFIDTLIINCFILENFFKRIEIPKEIIYVYESSCGPFNIFYFKKVYSQVFSSLLKLFCKKFNITYSEESYSKKKVFLDKQFRYFDYFKIKFLKSLLNFIRYKKYKQFLFRKSILDFGGNLLFLHTGSIDVDCILREFIGKKTKIFVCEKEKVIREDRLIREILDVSSKDDSFIENLRDECSKCARLLSKSCNIISWPNKKCSLDISEIVLIFLKDFIENVCFEILRDGYKLSKFYKKENIRYIFLRSSADIVSQKILCGARIYNKAKVIGVQHASYGDEKKTSFFSELYYCDYFLSRDNISTRYLRDLRSSLQKEKPEVIESPHYLKYVRKKVGECKSSDEKIIVYVPKKFSDGLRIFNSMIYPLEWYFEFQKKLIDFFATKKSYYFIYKHAPSQKWAENSIIPYIKKRNYSNISVSYKHFLEILGVADRVIVDFPSGALFEACICGKPVLCLYKDYIRIIPQAKTIFGKSLRGFTDFEEACRIIEEFLKTPPQEYKVDIPFDEVEFMQIFRKIIYGQKESI